LIARTSQVTLGTSSATSHRNGRTGCKFETDKNKPNRINKSGLTCLFCLYLFQRNPLQFHRYVSNRHRRLPCTGFLAFDIVHAVEFSRIGRAYFSPHGSNLGQLL